MIISMFVISTLEDASPKHHLAMGFNNYGNL